MNAKDEEKVVDVIEAEWENVLGCGAPGPGGEEPELFNQDQQR